MTVFRPDPALALPTLPGNPGRVDGPEALAQPHPVTRHDHVMSGRRIHLRADARDGILSLTGDGRAATGAWTAEGVAPANVVRGPRSLRRELVGPGGTILETVVVPERLPGVSIQYERIAGPGALSGLVLGFDPLPGAEEIRYRTEDARAVLEDSTRRLTVVVVPEDEARVSFDTDRGRLRVELALSVGVPVTLLLMLDPVGERGASLGALAALNAHRTRAELDAMGEDHAGLVVETGVAEIDEGVRWIRARLRDRLRSEPGVAGDALHPVGGGDAEDPMAEGWIVRGALAAGDHEVAKAALTAMSPGPDALVAWARWIGWTGDHHLLLDHRDRIASGLDALSGLPPFTGDRLRKLVADAVEAAGEEEWAERLRSEVAAPPTDDAAPTPKSRTLPVIGGTSSASTADLAMAAAFALPLPHPSQHDRDAVAAALRDTGAGGPDPVALFTLDRPEEGWLELRSELSRWAIDAPAAEARGARALAAFVEGMLGVRPDAAYGRIRIAPALPAHWTKAVVRGITVERVRITMHWSRNEGRHQWLFVPEAGSVPGMLIFEPRIPGRAVREVRIDGQVAEVAVERVGDRMVLQVQLPADGERRIEVDVEEFDGAT